PPIVVTYGWPEGHIVPATDLCAPSPSQERQVTATFFLKPKISNPFIGVSQIPFIRISMLEQPPALEIMLAHRTLEGMNRPGNQRIPPPQFSKCEMERLLITIDVLIVES